MPIKRSGNNTFGTAKGYRASDTAQVLARRIADFEKTKGSKHMTHRPGSMRNGGK